MVVVVAMAVCSLSRFNRMHRCALHRVAFLSIFASTCVLLSPRYEEARAVVPAHIRLLDCPYDDAWLRDTGPTFVVNDKLSRVAGIDWEFNAWGGLNGGCYSEWHQDNLYVASVAWACLASSSSSSSSFSCVIAH